MAAVAGMASLYDLPNFVGPLHKVTSEDTILLSMSGGLTGGDEVFATDHYCVHLNHGLVIQGCPHCNVADILGSQQDVILGNGGIR